jgi:hypothetical protein
MKGPGKWAEAQVQAWLKKEAAKTASFCYNRILDAGSARGAMSNPQPGDFQWFLDLGYTVGSGVYLLPVTRNGLIEVKSVEHTHRLPYKNFGEGQVARMRIRAMAGSEPLILVAFRPEGHVPYWRTAPLEFFEARDPKKGSWDMSEINAYTECADHLEVHINGGTY